MNVPHKHKESAVTTRKVKRRLEIGTQMVVRRGDGQTAPLNPMKKKITKFLISPVKPEIHSI
jgi:hypothetical protein